jgi:uncharacterized FlaG/YvyC family protein
MEAVSMIGQSVHPRESVQRVPQGASPVATAPDNVQASTENLKRISAAVGALNAFHGDQEHTRFQFKVHPEYGTVQVTLFNYLTGEVVQEVPSGKLLDFSHRMQALSGLLLEEEA